MGSTIIEAARWHSLRITPRTCWSFVELADRTGRVGVGEATLGGREAAMAQTFERLVEVLIGHELAAVDLEPLRQAAATLADFAVVSALDQAVEDLRAQSTGVPVALALGGGHREAIGVYANVNRGIASRTPQGFAAQAGRAVADGFGAVKIAPFDGIELYGDAGKTVDRKELDAAFERIAAVRAAVGPGIDLMVDCHWRLNPATAEDVVRAIEPFHLYWLECPLPETPPMLDMLRSLRTKLNARGVRLAGGEELSLMRGFAPFLEAGAYDVMMPDVKYVGGMREMLAVADALSRRGVGFSPHNPSGPVCHAASLHVCSAASHIERLELQYDETPLFDALVNPAIPRPADGTVRVPSAAGLGVKLEPGLVERLRIAPA